MEVHSLPVIAMRLLPHIFRHAGFPHRQVGRRSIVDRLLGFRGLLGQAGLNLRHHVEVFVVLIFAAVPLADLLFAGDEFDRFNPLDYFVAELVLDAQPQRRSVEFGKRLVVHLVGQKTLAVQHVFELLRVVVFTAVQPL